MVEQQQPEPAALGEKHLTTIHAIGQSLAIGPIFSAGLLAGLIASVAGFSTPASVLLASIGAMALAYIVSLYARKYAGAGAIYEYLTRGASPALGVIAGGAYFLAMLVVQGSFAIGIGFLTNGFWINHISATGAPKWWIFSIIYVAIILALNYFGVKVAIQAIIALAVLSTIPLLILAVSIIAQGGADGQALRDVQPVPRFEQRDLQRRPVRGHAVHRLRGRGVDRRGDGEPAPLDPARGHDVGRAGRGLLPADDLRDDDRLRRGEDRRLGR